MLYRLTSEDTLESANSSLALRVKNYQTFGKLRFFYVFEKSIFCSPRLHLMDPKKLYKFEILLQFKTAVFYVNKC